MNVLNSVENNGGLNWWGNSNEGTEYMHRKKLQAALKHLPV